MISATAELYGRNLSPAALELFWQDIRDLSYEQVNQALFRYRNGAHNFMPTPGQIRAALDGDPEQQALAAWSKFVRAAEQVGAYGSPVFDDPRIHVVIREMGGWVRNAIWDEDEEPWLKREFVTRYRALVGRPIENPPALVGIHESENSGRFPEHVPKARLVGDQESAGKVQALIEGDRDRSTEVLRLVKKALEEGAA